MQKYSLIAKIQGNSMQHYSIIVNLESPVPILGCHGECNMSNNSQEVEKKQGNFPSTFNSARGGRNNC